MKEQLIQEVQRQMLPYLNNAQLKQLQGVWKRWCVAWILTGCPFLFVHH